MRCISPHARYSIQVFEANEQVMMDARGHAFTQVVSKPVIADFDRGGLTDWEQLAALETFNFSGLPEGVNALTRIGTFDTEAFVMRYPERERDEMQVQIDQRLRELQQRHPSEFIVVDPPVAERPWPSYDDNSVEDVLKFQEALRYSPEKIRLYELENKNRPELIEAMLRLEDPEGAEREYGPANERITVEV